MPKPLLRRLLNRVLHTCARHAPGATSLRPFLHRLRGMKIGADVFIGDEVYLENEYPECVEIGDGVQISLRAVVLAHTRGAGRVVIEKSAYIGPQVVIACSGTRELRIGAGSVLSAGCMITRDVPSGVLMSVDPPRSVASVTLPLSEAETFQDFVRGLRPIRTQKATPAAEPASDSK